VYTEWLIDRVEIPFALPARSDVIVESFYRYIRASGCISMHVVVPEIAGDSACIVTTGTTVAAHPRRHLQFPPHRQVSMVSEGLINSPYLKIFTCHAAPIQFMIHAVKSIRHSINFSLMHHRQKLA
jgi:hypothetical protein